MKTTQSASLIQCFRGLPARIFAVVALPAAFCLPAMAQSQTPLAFAAVRVLPDAPTPQPGNPAPKQKDEPVSLSDVPRNFIEDQKAIWTSPVRVRARDLKWMAPLALGLGAAIATDHRAMSQTVSQNIDFNNANINVSNVMIGGLIATSPIFYGAGALRHDERARETGLLSGEAMVDGVVVEQGMKLVFWRERPSTDGARGRFFQGSAGIDSSFPSSHTVIAWAAASAIAGEYKSPWQQALAYSAATGVSLTRVLGQQHFPSDVLAGSAAGWLIGHYVIRRHHKTWLK